MAGESREPEGLIARRLDHLFRTVHPKDRKPYTHAEVAEAINKAAGGHVIGATYVYQLRTGRSDNPTYKHLLALARFFGVSPTYFFDEPGTGTDPIPAEVALALKDDDVRDLALEAAGPGNLAEHRGGGLAAAGPVRDPPSARSAQRAARNANNALISSPAFR
jgi:transcriptional regulator with XRE-family HTH domain